MAVGTLIVVQPGEKVPIDGTVVSGHSTLNTAALTGESLPLDVEPGMAVVSGSINQQGVLKICTSKEFCDSTVSKILELVEDAGSRKSKSENFISKFARYTRLLFVAVPWPFPLFRPLCGSSWALNLCGQAGFTGA